MIEQSGATASRKPPTLYDVAALADVSHQTVSRLVKGHTNIHPDIRVRVEAAIAELRYRPNLVARSLATATSRRIGVLFFDRLDQVGPTRSVQEASDRAREAGYFLDIIGLASQVESEIERAIAAVDRVDVAGIMVFAPTSAVREAIKRASFPVPVFIDFDPLGPSKPVMANIKGTQLLIQHLAELGHQRFFTITGPTGWDAAQVRLQAYVDAVAATGGVSVGECEGDWGAQSGYDAILRMPLDAGITAVVAANDQMALGAIKACETRGIRVPEDLSVVGFDNVTESLFFKPALTTIGFDFGLQGRIAMEELLQMIDPNFAVAAESVLEPRLILRASTAHVT